MAPPLKSLADRFWPKVQVSNQADCWEWEGGKSGDGYGAVGTQNSELMGEITRAHRLAWYLHNGPIPVGIMVCHHCDNPGCVNPAHLFLADKSGNMKDAYEKGRLHLDRAWAANRKRRPDRGHFAKNAAIAEVDTLEDNGRP